MTLSHSPAPARSDVATAAPTGSSPRHPYAVHGRVLTIGALAWAAAIAGLGLDPRDSVGVAVYGLGSGLFQVGLLVLLRTLWRTRALGEGRVARGVLRLETVLVSLAITSTLVDAIQLSDLSQPGWALLDAFWPLSMLGMFLIGIRIAIAGRWTGLSRLWPVVAESWAVVTIPALGIFGPGVGQVVACVHLVVGYAVLGLLVSRKTD
ncbi:hypothetical protein KDN32_19310 [Nocardioides sp. J2M5]|uniref:hypothetical protein n=1 Tax=Nocardioides palaemonis TaxID=2829810 RepID=UPI001BA5E87C|nr:hypothetical protein [Nocardioides palaemonis]MBS2939895.1 hypothetical protein [Nocardioides palaemonis]